MPHRVEHNLDIVADFDFVHSARRARAMQTDAI